MPGTEHFRNVKRYSHLETWPDLLLLRVDEHLSFANTAWLEETLMNRVAGSPRLKHLVLVASGINGIDTSGLETLSRLALSFKEAGITLHLAEVKGPVMDRLKRSHRGDIQHPTPALRYHAWQESRQHRSQRRNGPVVNPRDDLL